MQTERQGHVHLLDPRNMLRSGRDGMETRENMASLAQGFSPAKMSSVHKCYSPPHSNDLTGILGVWGDTGPKQGGKALSAARRLPQHCAGVHSPQGLPRSPRPTSWSWSCQPAGHPLRSKRLRVHMAGKAHSSTPACGTEATGMSVSSSSLSSPRISVSGTRLPSLWPHSPM